MKRSVQLAAALQQRGWNLTDTLTAAQKQDLADEFGVSAGAVKVQLAIARADAGIVFRANQYQCTEPLPEWQKAPPRDGPQCAAAECFATGTERIGSYVWCPPHAGGIRMDVEAMRARFEGQGR